MKLNPTPNALGNIMRLMVYLKIWGLIDHVLRVDDDRIWCLVRKDRNNLHQWCETQHRTGYLQRDHNTVAGKLHCNAEYGPVLVSYRESKDEYHPAMQITFHAPLDLPVTPDWAMEIACKTCGRSIHECDCQVLSERNPVTRRICCLVAEIDIDYSAPVDILGAVWHFGEIMWNRLTGHKTSQAMIARMLDRRLGALNAHYFCGADSCDDPACVTHNKRETD